MPFRALGYVTGLLGILAAPLPMGWNPCPDGRTLKRQLNSADVVVVGEITYDSDCRPPELRNQDSRTEFVDCIGRRANLIISRTWKGPAQAGHALALTMPAPSDSAGLLMRKGETHVVFAKLFSTAKSPNWFGETTACMLPEAAASSDGTLVEQLDLWFRTHRS